MGSKFRSMRGNRNLTQGLLDLIKHINGVSPTKGMRLLEIGAYTGESTSIFCQHFENVVTIDPYSCADERRFAPMAEVYGAFCWRMSQYTNYTLVKKTSDDAFEELADRRFDVVYIDGNHSYEYVKRDILNYQKLVKAGGFLAGHDYSDSWAGVKQAVNECFGRPHMQFRDSSWLIRKDDVS